MCTMPGTLVMGADAKNVKCMFTSVPGHIFPHICT